MTDSELEKKLHSEIPLTRFLGLTVSGSTENSLTLCIPFSPAKNDKNTGFAGALYSAAVLVGWGLLHKKLTEAGITVNLAAKETSMNFNAPVTADFEAFSQAPENNALENWLALVRDAGKGRLYVKSEIRQDGVTRAVFKGEYIAY